MDFITLMDSAFDEFGNYIGGGVEVSSESSESVAEELMAVDEPENQSVVLYHEKEHFPDASEVYGSGTEVLIEMEDAQPLETPIVAPIVHKTFEVEESIPETSFDISFLTDLMAHPQFIRNIAVMGHLHHGKTSFIDLLIRQTHFKASESSKELKYLDTRFDEQQKGISIKCRPISLALPNCKGKTFILNLIDTPGHPDFADEQASALQLSDGVVLVVDVVEGVMLNTRRSIRMAVKSGLGIVLVLNKMDRLPLELRVSPEDAYLKLRHVLNEVNAVLTEMCDFFGRDFDVLRIHPSKGNVVFASSKYLWCYSTASFIHKCYSEVLNRSQQNAMVQRMWGEHFYNEETEKITPEGDVRTFVSFILRPIYKIFSHTLGCDPPELFPLLKELGILLNKTESYSDPEELLKIVFSRFLPHSDGFVGAVVDHIPNPIESAALRLPVIYRGDISSSIGQQMISVDASAPLVLNITKVYPRPDGSAFDAFGRVWSGTIKPGMTVKVLREGYSPQDTEDMSIKEIGRLWILQGRYRVQVNQATVGSWVLIEGIDDVIAKTATICSLEAEDCDIFNVPDFETESVVKVAIEPLEPSERPKLMEGLLRISQTYPLCTNKVEESGEHVLFGTGEMYLDCVLYDLRNMFAKIEIKVSDPLVTFCETVFDISTVKSVGQTPNAMNSITMIAEPIEPGLGKAMEEGRVSSAVLRKEFGWDALAARSVWGFGPGPHSTNMLLDDTLPDEVDKSLMEKVKQNVLQGFQWASREGPLCDEPMRNVKFRILHMDVASKPLLRGAGQIIPMVRKVAYEAFRSANPRLMEPIYHVEVLCTSECIAIVEKVIVGRRGLLTLSSVKPGTPLHVLNAFVPVMDSFGFETDVRTHTHGQAFCLSVFHHWEAVPGDPLDSSIVLRPLEKSTESALGREFMLKVRRRKGLS